MKFDWRYELAHWLIIASLFLAAAVLWSHAPQQMPVHWNLEGQADRDGSRFEGLLLVPLIGIGLYLLLLFLPRLDPGYKNYQTFASAYQVIRLLLTVFLGGLQVVMLLAAFGYAVPMTRVMMLATGGLFLVLGNLMPKIRPNWFVGVRTPWTLSSKLSWTKTHRLAGWLFMGIGLAFVVAGIVGAIWLDVLAMVIAGVFVAWMVVYSYLVYRIDPQRTTPAGTSPAGTTSE